MRTSRDILQDRAHVQRARIARTMAAIEHRIAVVGANTARAARITMAFVAIAAVVGTLALLIDRYKARARR